VTTNTFKKAGLVCAAALAAVAAIAGIKTSGYYAANFSFNTATAFVPLTPSGGTSLTWNQGSAGRKVLIFSAECAVDAPAGNNFAWVDLDIIHNGTVLPPTVGTADAFCGADGAAGISSYVRPAISVVVPAVAGANTVRIRARLNAGATGGWVSDTSTVIMD
jgi:hypothetical protein